MVPVAQWNTALTSTPRRTSSSCAASMSATISSRPCAEPGGARGQVGAELNRAPGAGRRELDQPKVLARAVGVEPPPQGAVELLRPVDVRYGNNDYLEPHVDLAAARVGGAVRLSCS
jgi:hypothetical protein